MKIFGKLCNLHFCTQFVLKMKYSHKSKFYGIFSNLMWYDSTLSSQKFRNLINIPNLKLYQILTFLDFLQGLIYLLARFDTYFLIIYILWYMYQIIFFDIVIESSALKQNLNFYNKSDNIKYEGNVYILISW